MKIDDLEERELIPGTRVRFIHSDRMTVAHWHFDPGIDLPKHSHPHDVLHSGRSITACKIIDAFSPVRDDYL